MCKCGGYVDECFEFIAPELVVAGGVFESLVVEPARLIHFDNIHVVAPAVLKNAVEQYLRFFCSTEPLAGQPRLLKITMASDFTVEWAQGGGSVLLLDQIKLIIDSISPAVAMMVKHAYSPSIIAKPIFESLKEMSCGLNDNLAYRRHFLDDTPGPEDIVDLDELTVHGYYDYLGLEGDDSFPHEAVDDLRAKCSVISDVMVESPVGVQPLPVIVAHTTPPQSPLGPTDVVLELKVLIQRASNALHSNGGLSHFVQEEPQSFRRVKRRRVEALHRWLESALARLKRREPLGSLPKFFSEFAENLINDSFGQVYSALKFCVGHYNAVADAEPGMPWGPYNHSGVTFESEAGCEMLEAYLAGQAYFFNGHWMNGAKPRGGSYFQHWPLTVAGCKYGMVETVRKNVECAPKPFDVFEYFSDIEPPPLACTDGGDEHG